MSQPAPALQRAFSHLLDLARADGYGSQPQLFALTWFAAARMVLEGMGPNEGLASLAETSSWKDLVAVGLPEEWSDERMR